MTSALNLALTAKTFRVAVVGVGLVGSEFIRQLLAFPAPSPFRLVSLSSSKATVFDPDGLSITSSDWTSALAGSGRKPDLQTLLSELSALVKPGQEVVLVDNTSSNDVAAFYPQFLKFGVNVITPNKKAFSSELSLYEQILAASLDSGARFLNEATVGAGLPVISTLKDLVATGDKVLKIEGVFSGTMSYIFNEFSTGKTGGPSFSSVVSVAREKGYTEPHPADDLNGADVARKLTILSRFIPSLRAALPNGYQSVSTKSLVPPELEGITSGDEFIQRLPEFDAHFDKMRAEAAEEGKVLRFAGVVDVQAGIIKADLEKYSIAHPFATALGGSDNIIMFHTERYGARPLVVQGAGAGAAVTAMGVLSDLLKLV
ncbi:aspartate kinase homoserine dehydrogenase [Trametes gibbosa]|nr:aspartate kinase homoserine dehydrogenase [Trametes gibbosa]